jgi:hypothetical protein
VRAGAELKSTGQQRCPVAELASAAVFLAGKQDKMTLTCREREHAVGLMATAEMRGAGVARLARRQAGRAAIASESTADTRSCPAFRKNLGTCRTGLTECCCR